MTDGRDTRRDNYLNSGKWKLPSEIGEDSGKEAGEPSLAEHVAVSESLSNVPEG